MLQHFQTKMDFLSLFRTWFLANQLLNHLCAGKYRNIVHEVWIQYSRDALLQINVATIAHVSDLNPQTQLDLIQLNFSRARSNKGASKRKQGRQAGLRLRLRRQRIEQMDSSSFSHLGKCAVPQE